MAECASASLIFTSFIDVPSLVGVDPRFLNCIISSSVFPFIHVLVHGLGLLLFEENSALVTADFHAVTSSSLLQSFSVLLKFFLTASRQIDVVSKA